jgi:hypothetical protein
MEATTTICKNCGHTFSGKYCNACGQKVYTVKDKKLSHIVEEGFHFMTHFEGSFFTTLKTMFAHPGKLSLDYCDGIRKRYFKPLSFFLLLVVIYLLFPAFEGLNMQMHFYADHSLFGTFAAKKINTVMAQTHMSMEQLGEVFHHKSEKVSKFMLLVIIPFTALFCYLLTFKKRRYFFDQMVFASEVSAFFLLWTFLILSALILLSEMIYKAIAGHYYNLNDDQLGVVAFSTLAVFVFLAARRFYYLKKWQAFLFTLIFLGGFYIIVNWVYKFLLFVAVINQIH